MGMGIWKKLWVQGGNGENHGNEVRIGKSLGWCGSEDSLFYSVTV